MSSPRKQRGSETPVSPGMGFKEGPHLERQESRCYRNPGALLQGRRRAGTRWEKVSCVCGFPSGSTGKLRAGSCGPSPPLARCPQRHPVLGPGHSQLSPPKALSEARLRLSASAPRGPRRAGWAPSLPDSDRPDPDVLTLLMRRSLLNFPSHRPRNLFLETSSSSELLLTALLSSRGSSIP